MKKQEVTVFLTEKEQPYISGVLKDSDAILVDNEAIDAELQASEQVVDWPVESEWRKESLQTVLKGHIHEHKLSTEGSWWFTYRLQVKASAEGSFKFTDKSGDVYHLGVSNTARVHYLDYNSDNPEIILVEYTP